MHHSMTAFARVSAEHENLRVNIELKSVNNRYLEISPRLPEKFRHLEAKIRELLQKRIKRGKVDCWVNYELSAGEQTAKLNSTALQDWLSQLNDSEIKQTLGNPTWQDLLSLPGVVETCDVNTEGNDEWFLTLFDSAIDELLAMRAREGNAITELLKQKLDEMAQLVSSLQAHIPAVQASIKANILARLNELDKQVDSNRFEQELVYLLSKADVDEELERLNFHIAETRHALAKKGAVGRRLDFLMQEFNRESNTLGAKAADNKLSQAGVALKVLIEQMREQVQNLE